jgi:hypothetical protein
MATRIQKEIIDTRDTTAKELHQIKQQAGLLGTDILTQGGIPYKQIMAKAMPLTPNARFELVDKPGWHATWMIDDNLTWAKSVGYREIRDIEGHVIDRPEGDKKFSRALEIPEDVYRKHLADIAIRSHQMYSQPEVVLAETARQTNRDLGGMMEHVTPFTSEEVEHIGVEVASTISDQV